MLARRVAVWAAQLEDRDLFKTLWIKYLQETAQAGGPYLPTEKTLGFYTSLFIAYSSGRWDGVVLLASDAAGVLMWGAVPGDDLPLDFRYGRVAQGWGTYVEPAHRRQGVASALRTVAKRRLVEMGFDAVIGEAWAGNKAGLRGCVPRSPFFCCA